MRAHAVLPYAARTGASGCNGHLAHARRRRHPALVDEEQGIYRGEVTTIMGVLVDVNVKVDRILAYIEGGDDEEEEEH